MATVPRQEKQGAHPVPGVLPHEDISNLHSCCMQPLCVVSPSASPGQQQDLPWLAPKGFLFL